MGIAISLAASGHQSQTDKAGNPYILHCLYVMNKCRHYDEETMQMAVMHDLIEDTDTTLDDLRQLGFSERVISGLDCLTHRKDEPYGDYIERISSNIDAMRVKCKDLRHNSDITRMKGVRQKDFDRIAKYHEAFKLLTDRIEEYENGKR